MIHFNTVLFTSINQLAGQSSAIALVMVWITDYLPYAMVGIVIGYFFLWGVRSRSNIQQSVFRTIQTVEWCSALFGTFVITHILKIFTALPRPFLSLAHVIVLVPDQGGFSFPSMHTSLTTALAMSVYIHHKRLGVLLFIFAVLVGFSRIYVGVHYPIDVLAGGLIGAGVAYVTHRFFGYIIRHTNQ